MPAVADRIETRLLAFDDFASAVKIPWPVLVPVGAALLVIALPDRTWFLGDFILRQGTVALGDEVVKLPQVLPLDQLLHVRLPQALSIASVDAANAYARFVGAIDAALLAFLALRWGSVLGGTLSERALLAMITFFGGFLTVFTGFGKSSAEQCVITLAVGVFGMRALRGANLLPLGASVALGLLLHRSVVLLLPAALFLFAVRARRGLRAADLLAFAVLAGTLLLMTPRLLHIFQTFDLPRHAAGESWIARAIDPRHLRNVLNLLLVLSPVGIAALPLITARVPEGRRGERAFLALLLVPPLVLLLAERPAQGLFRDWDVFAPWGVAFSMAASWGLGLVLPRPGWPRVALPAAAAAASCALAWMLHFSDLPPGLRRVETHARHSTSLDERERAAAWEFLGQRQAVTGNWEASAAALARAVALKPSRYLYVSWALAEYQAGSPAGARSAFDSLTARHPEYPLGWFGYGAASAWLEDSAGVRRGLEGVRRTLKTSADAREIERFVEAYPFVVPDSAARR